MTEQLPQDPEPPVPAPSRPAPGWYQDPDHPNDAGYQRWWNGSDWTEGRRASSRKRSGRSLVVPLEQPPQGPEPPVPAPSRPAPGWYQDPDHPNDAGYQRWWNGSDWTEGRRASSRKRSGRSLVVALGLAPLALLGVVATLALLGVVVSVIDPTGSVNSSAIQVTTSQVTTSEVTTRQVDTSTSVGVAATPTTTPAPSTIPSTAPEAIPGWELVELEDVSFGSTTRWVAHVVTQPEVTVAQLERVARQVAEELRTSEYDYQALSVGFYDYPEYLGFGFVMGYWEHAPYGDWARASEATLGDYGTFEETSNLRAKDWSQRPTPDEVAIWQRWEQTLAEISDFPDLEDEGAAYDLVAIELGIPRIEVVGAVETAASWIWQEVFR